MEDLYKKTRLIAWLTLVVLIISHLIDIDSIESSLTMTKIHFDENEEWNMTYNWLGGIVGLIEIALYAWFFLLLKNTAKTSNTNKKTSIVALVGLGLVLLNNLIYAGEFFFASAYYPRNTWRIINHIRLLALLYPGRLIFALAVIMTVRKLHRTSLAYTGGISYATYAIATLLYNMSLCILSMSGKYIVTDDYEKYMFWYYTLPLIVSIAAELAIFLFLLGCSMKRQIEQSQVTEENVTKKKAFFLKRWLVGLSNAVYRWLFKETSGSEAIVGGIFWILFIVSFILGGVNLAISFFGNTDTNTNLIVIVGALSLGPIVLSIVSQLKASESVIANILRVLFLIIWNAIGIALGYAMGTIVVAAVILIFFVWLILKMTLFSDSGSGKGRSWKLSDGTNVKEESGLLGDKSYVGDDGMSYEKNSDDTFSRQ